MSSEITAKDEADLEAFLAGRSAISADYKALEAIEPPEALDARVLAGARAAAAPPASAEARPPAAAASGATEARTARPAASRPPAVRQEDTDDDDDEDEVVHSRRPRWLIPVAVAAVALVAIGLGALMLGDGSDGFDPNASSPLDAIFARKVRERLNAEKAAAAAAAQEAEEVELELAPLPPPPFFEAGGPQVDDLDASIALVRRELVRANQAAAMAQAAAAAPSVAGAPEATSVPVAPAVDAAVAGVIQPRDRRLAKILELYDAGNHDLAADSLEIFLRDFPDAPISQQLMDAQPRVTDIGAIEVAVD